MTQLFLIRHGQSTWNAEGRIQGWADPPLDETGHDQARKLAQRLVAEGHDHCGDLQQPAAARPADGRRDRPGPRSAVQTDDRLKENNVGQLTGLTGPEVEQQFPDWVAARQASREWMPPPAARIATTLSSAPWR